MNPRALFGFLGCAVLMVTPLPAANPAPAPLIATVALKDGRVLHNVRVMANEGASIVLRADEGLLKIAKANLPAGLIDSAPMPAPTTSSPAMVMQPFNPNQAPPADPEENRAPKAKLPTKKTETPVPAAPNLIFKGCSIVSFQKKAFQNVAGCAEIVVVNETDDPVALVPADFVCIDASGGHYPGRFIVKDGMPPHIKRSDTVPPHGKIDDTVTFTDTDIEVASVQWSR